MKKISNDKPSLVCGGICYCYGANHQLLHSAQSYVEEASCKKYCCDPIAKPGVESWETSTGLAGPCDIVSKHFIPGNPLGRSPNKNT